jgi:hypothetical protein
VNVHENINVFPGQFGRRTPSHLRGLSIMLVCYYVILTQVAQYKAQTLVQIYALSLVFLLSLFNQFQAYT